MVRLSEEQVKAAVGSFLDELQELVRFDPDAQLTFVTGAKRGEGAPWGLERITWDELVYRPEGSAADRLTALAMADRFQSLSMVIAPIDAVAVEQRAASEEKDSRFLTGKGEELCPGNIAALIDIDIRGGDHGLDDAFLAAGEWEALQALEELAACGFPTRFIVRTGGGLAALVIAKDRLLTSEERRHIQKAIRRLAAEKNLPIDPGTLVAAPSFRVPGLGAGKARYAAEGRLVTTFNPSEIGSWGRADEMLAVADCIITPRVLDRLGPGHTQADEFDVFERDPYNLTALLFAVGATPSKFKRWVWDLETRAEGDEVEAIHEIDGEIRRVRVNDPELRTRVGIPEGVEWSALDWLINSICDGDAGLAAQAVRAHDADITKVARFLVSATKAQLSETHTPEESRSEGSSGERPVMHSADTSSVGRPLDRLAANPANLDALLRAAGAFPSDRPCMWDYPRPDGTVDSSPSIDVMEDDDANRLRLFGERFAADFGLDPSQQWTSAAWLCEGICQGDASLAARISYVHGGDITEVAEELLKSSPAKLLSLYPRGAKPRTTRVPNARPAPNPPVGPGDEPAAIPDSVSEAPVSSPLVDRVGAALPGTLPEGFEEVAAETASWELTEVGMARRWRRVFGAEWRFMATEKGAVWRWWDGRVWTEAAHHHIAASVTELVETLIPVEADVLAARARESTFQRPPRDGKGRELTSDKLLEAADDAATSAYTTHIRAAQPFATSRALEAVRKLLPAQSPREALRLETDLSSWDRDRHLLNTPSAVIDLRTGQRIPHDPKFLMSRITTGSGEDVPPTTDVLALWKPFGPPGTAGHKMLSLIAGLALTGETARFFTQIIGPPRSGKTTPIQAFVAALGGDVEGGEVASSPGYAVVVPAKIVNRSRSGAPSPELSSLNGARLAFIDEAETTLDLDAPIVKLISGGGTLTGRRLFQNGERWQSTTTLVMTGNSEIRLPATDRGLQERLYPLRMESPLDPSEADFGLATRVVRDQVNLDALLAVMIRHATRFYEHGGDIGAVQQLAPTEALATRVEMVEESSPVVAWLDALGPCAVIPERYLPTNTSDMRAVSSTAEAWDAFTAWAQTRIPNWRRSIATRKDFLEALGAEGVAVNATLRARRDSRRVQVIPGLRRIDRTRPGRLHGEGQDDKWSEVPATSAEIAAGFGDRSKNPATTLDPRVVQRGYGALS